MSDLSKRLREICDRHDAIGNMPLISTSELLRYADLIDQQAAEIERLKKKLVIKLDDYYGTPCEQIRHRQELDDMRSQRDEWRRRAELMHSAMDHVHYPRKAFYTVWSEFLSDQPEAAQWFED